MKRNFIMCKLYRYFWIPFLLFNVYSAYAVPCAGVFSPLKRVLSASADTEKNLLRRGFSQYYVNYVDTAVHLVKLKKRWMKKKNPEDMHIPYFAWNIEAHIAEIRKGIKASSLSDVEKSSRLEALKALEKEAFFKKKIHKMTYMWWNIFNIRLITLTADSVESAFNLGLSLNQVQNEQEVYRVLKEKKDSSAFNGPYVQMLEKFPNIVLIPVVGDIGPMAFNQVMSESIHFVGVSGTEAKVDGKKLSPQDYVRHDVEHANSIEEYLKTEDLSFHSQFKRKIKDLPQEVREQQELAYFLLLHERGSVLQGSDRAVFDRNFHVFASNPIDTRLLPHTLSAVYVQDRKKYKELLREYFDQMNRHYTALFQEIRNSN